MKAQAKAPLSSHPLFPWIVALWSAALLGMGSLAISTALIERVVLTTRLELAIPAAAPPLGFTARMLVALGLALGGAVLGYVLGLLISRRARGVSRRRTPPTSVDMSGAAGPEPEGDSDDEDLVRLKAAREGLPLRRRALTSEHETLAEIPATHTPPMLTAGDLAAIEPLGAVPEQTAHSVAAGPAPERPESVAVPVEVPASPKRDAEIDPGLREAPLAALGVAELVERFGRALKTRRERDLAVRAAVAQDASHGTTKEAVTSAPAPLTVPIAIPSPAKNSFAPAPFASRSFDGAFGPVARDRPFDMPGSRRMPGVQGASEWLDEAEEEATLESLLPPRRALSDHSAAGEVAEHQAAWALPESDESDEDESEANSSADDDGARYSSLLDMKRGNRPDALAGEPPSFVRIDDDGAGAGFARNGAEPVVIFPGQAVPPPPIPARLPGNPLAATPVETEQALRDALAALQRMSGTA